MRFLKEKDTRVHHRSTRHRTWNKRSVFTVVDKNTVLSYINIIRTDGPIYLKQVNELNTLARKHHLHVLVGLIETRNWKTDTEFLNDFSKFIKTIINKSNELADAIEKNLPDNYNFYSSNLNITVTTFLLYLGRFVIDLPVFLDNVTSLYDVSLSRKNTIGTPASRTIIRRFISDFNYLDLTGLTKEKNIEEIIESIGNYPTGNNLSKNIPMSIKEEIISGVLGNNKIGKIVTNFLASFKTGTDHNATKYVTETRNKNVTYGFAGNPIYYIRKIIADLEINGYEKRKLERKKLELKLQYLNEKASKEMDKSKLETYKKQIEILEEKIERLEAKEKAFIDKLERKK
jgi:hypothetical protein